MKRMRDLVLIDFGEYNETTSKFVLENNVLLSTTKNYYVIIEDDAGYTMGQLIIFPTTTKTSTSVDFGRGAYDDMPAFAASITAFKSGSHTANEQYQVSSENSLNGWTIKVYEVM